MTNSKELSSIRVKKREEHSKRHKKMESQVCFNDATMKREFD
jgi:hypothetical protein